MAMLIDGDNAQPSLIVKLMAEAGKYGATTIRRIYGDWTTPQMNGWKDCLNNHAIQPIQQFRYTVGKNATDSALIIDAMDLLHSEFVNGFCIVSSDSDYTRLATRIREAGIFVMGIGQRKTPKPFVNACNVFIFTENLTDDIDEKKIAAATKEPESGGTAKQAPNPVPLLKEAFVMSEDEDGWAHLGVMGVNLRQLDPSFDPRTFGYGQLLQLIKAQKDLFTIRKEDDKGPSAVYVKRKDKPKSRTRKKPQAEAKTMKKPVS
ncbi:NYN domain-containing protein [Pontibacter saemangeumensis]|uniref:NYN domain-containing protein n=1 Tax=Pontibacter saemangeumensis TaxID=1084525 RepID=A0ABP8M4U9_9BACT